MSNYTIEQIRRGMVKAALNDWRQPIRDYHPGQEATPHLIQSLYWSETGWQWFLDKHSDGTYTERFKGQVAQKYCGLAVASWGLRVGDFVDDQSICVDVSLREDVASEALPSTKRIANPKHWCEDCPDFERPGKMQLKVGDVICVGDGRHGSHVAMVREDRKSHNTQVRTIEANSVGKLGDGTTGEGVVKKARTFDEIKQTARFTKDHFTGSALDD